MDKATEGQMTNLCLLAGACLTAQAWFIAAAGTFQRALSLLRRLSVSDIAGGTNRFWGLVGRSWGGSWGSDTFIVCGQAADWAVDRRLVRHCTESVDLLPTRLRVEVEIWLTDVTQGGARWG